MIGFSLCNPINRCFLKDIPRLPIDDALEDPNRDEEIANRPEKRRPMRLLDSLVQRDDEYSDSEDEGEGGRRNHARHRDSESATTPKRFGVGVGIMGAAPPGAGSAAAAAAANTGGAPPAAIAGGSGGPSAHSPVLEALVRRKEENENKPDAKAVEGTGADADGEAMEVDSTAAGKSEDTQPAGVRESPMDVETPEPPVSTERPTANGADEATKDDKPSDAAAPPSTVSASTSEAAPVTGGTAASGETEKPDSS